MHITIAGIGPGHADLITCAVKEHLLNASCVIGSDRQLGVVDRFLPAFATKLPYAKGLKSVLDQALSAHMAITLLASGDPNFFGIAQWIRINYPKAKVTVLSGISSVQYLFNALGWTMNDLFMTSGHGRSIDIRALTQYKKVAILTDANLTPYTISKTLLEKGLDPLMAIGENLSYPDECISVKKASAVENREYQMNVVVIDYER